MQTDTDFLGLFYESFLRYGYDNNALGIVFTPRHITKFCADLIDVKATDKVVDIACGTGGFLVASFDRMMTAARGPSAKRQVKESLFGYDTNPTIWALATLNMFFRGDGKTHIENRSCLEQGASEEVERRFTKAFLNPPFSQAGEPEKAFIDVSMRSLKPEGLFAAVVKASVFADDKHKNWRREFTRNHTVLGVVSLPGELFYPTAAHTSILIARAHIPHPRDEKVFIAKISNDGFGKLKNRRVHVEGSQLPDAVAAFRRTLHGKETGASNSISLASGPLLDGNEWSPQQWLPQPMETEEELSAHERDVKLSVFRAVASIPELGDSVLDDFAARWSSLPEMEYGATKPVRGFFDVVNGRSTGEKNYRDGSHAYVSSGDATNSIVRLIDWEDEEVFESGAITVTAFGQAHVQPWAFMARGNGGNSVRVLIPKFKMSYNELVWFASQINAQKWRFIYSRMAIKSRLEKLEIASPPEAVADSGETISERVARFRETLMSLSDAGRPDPPRSRPPQGGDGRGPSA